MSNDLSIEIVVSRRAPDGTMEVWSAPLTVAATPAPVPDPVIVPDPVTVTSPPPAPPAVPDPVKTLPVPPAVPVTDPMPTRTEDNAPLVSVQAALTPDDDSCLIALAPGWQAIVPGAASFHFCPTSEPDTWCKDSGGSDSVEVNGIDPALGMTGRLYFTDALLPYMEMSLHPGPFTAEMPHIINGQADPALAMPKVLARSQEITLTTAPFVLGGTHPFTETFRAFAPLAAVPLPTALASIDSNFFRVQRFENERWEITTFGANEADTVPSAANIAVPVVDKFHWMDDLYDGPNPVAGFSHNNISTTQMRPKTSHDLSGGGVLYFTVMIAPHFTGRRFWNVDVRPAGEELLDPGKFAEFARLPSASGNLLRWSITDTTHCLNVYGKNPDGTPLAIPILHQDHGIGPDSGGLCARSGPWCKIPFNGTDFDLDKKRKFELLLSLTQIRITEGGTVVVDRALEPGAAALMQAHFSGPVQVSLAHQLYHTSNEHAELMLYSPQEDYYINRTPWHDLSHVDNIGATLLTGFPPL